MTKTKFPDIATSQLLLFFTITILIPDFSTVWQPWYIQCQVLKNKYIYLSLDSTFLGLGH